MRKAQIGMSTKIRTRAGDTVISWGPLPDSTSFANCDVREVRLSLIEGGSASERRAPADATYLQALKTQIA